MVPHITNEIKERIYTGASSFDADIVITEIGGTTGDIESLPFLEAIRQIRLDLGYENTLYIHTTLLPYIGASHEVKTKPTQHSVKELRGLGIQPDFIVCRSEKYIEKEILLDEELQDKGEGIETITKQSSTIIKNSELIFNFIEEVSKIDEMRQAIKKGQDYPKRNWINIFNNFANLGFPIIVFIKIKDSLRNFSSRMFCNAIERRNSVFSILGLFK